MVKEMPSFAPVQLKISPEMIEKVITNIPKLGTERLLENLKLEKDQQVKKAIIEELTIRLEKEKNEIVRDEIMESLMGEEGAKFECRDKS